MPYEFSQAETYASYWRRLVWEKLLGVPDNAWTLKIWNGDTVVTAYVNGEEVAQVESENDENDEAYWMWWAGEKMPPTEGDWDAAAGHLADAIREALKL